MVDCTDLQLCYLYGCLYRDTIDSVKQSAALCLLHLLRSSADAIAMSEWSSRIIHLLNDQHMVTVIHSFIHSSASVCSYYFWTNE